MLLMHVWRSPFYQLRRLVATATTSGDAMCAFAAMLNVF